MAFGWLAEIARRDLKPFPTSFLNIESEMGPLTESAKPEARRAELNPAIT